MSDQERGEPLRCQSVTHVFGTRHLARSMDHRHTIAKHIRRPASSVQMAASKTSRHKTNRAWHAAHVMPTAPTLQQRIAWHRAHAKHCGCRPVPAKLQKLV